jgi:septal ring factor EnvC (AmiA/AmiB activator)
MDLNNSQVHRGQIVKNAVVKSGIKIAQLGRKLSKSRRFFYLMFENELMPIN